MASDHESSEEDPPVRVQHPYDVNADADAHSDNESQNGRSEADTRHEHGDTLHTTAAGTDNLRPEAAAVPPTTSSSTSNGAVRQRTPSQTRTCTKCNQALVGQFVRALDGKFHLECFKCRVCTIRQRFAFGDHVIDDLCFD